MVVIDSSLFDAESDLEPVTAAFLRRRTSDEGCDDTAAEEMSAGTARSPSHHCLQLATFYLASGICHLG
jgi:hypothetical protein